MYDKLVENWDKILEDLKYEYDFSNVSFNTWIKPLTVLSVDDEAITLIIGDGLGDMALDYINKKYYTFIKTYLNEYLGTELELRIVSRKADDQGEYTETSSFTETTQEENEFKQRSESANLNDKYTFDTFVVGSNNNIAHSASLAVAESLGSYNPLFIYGGVGLGKTHLIHSIGNFVLKENPDAKVLYTSSEPFTNEVIDIIRGNNTQEKFINFRKKYRTVDLLLIDDIQFLAGKERTQEEIFNIINELYMNQKQIVITSDKKPKDIEGIMQRLINRFEQGLTVDIQNPDYETRMAILKEKVRNEQAKNPNLKIDEEVLQYIANNFTSNIRELEGSFLRVIAFAKMERKPITLDFAKNTLIDLVSPGNYKKITCEDIIQIVADHYQINVSDICSSRRSKDISIPRQVCMYLCRKYTDEKLQTIAKSLKKGTHATVSHGIDKIKEDMESDAELKGNIEILEKKIDPN